MMTIKYPESGGSVCDYNGCTEVSCPANDLYLRVNTHFRLGEVITGRCPRIIEYCADKRINVALRVWVKDVFIDKKRVPLPPEIDELVKKMCPEP